MGKIDWDKGQRRERVMRNGAEPSEYRPDLTEQIASAKGHLKVRGPMASRRGKHVALIRCPKCPRKVYADVLQQHLRWHKLNPYRPAKPKPRIQCKVCGLKIKLTRLNQHMKHHGVKVKINVAELKKRFMKNRRMFTNASPLWRSKPAG